MFHSSAFPLSETEKHLGRVRHPGRSKSQRKLAHWQGPLHRPWAHTRPLRLLQTRPPYAAVYLAAPPAQFRDGSHLARLNPPNKAPPLQTGPSSFRTCPPPTNYTNWKCGNYPQTPNPTHQQVMLTSPTNGTYSVPLAPPHRYLLSYGPLATFGSLQNQHHASLGNSRHLQEAGGHDSADRRALALTFLACCVLVCLVYSGIFQMVPESSQRLAKG